MAQTRQSNQAPDELCRLNSQLEHALNSLFTKVGLVEEKNRDVEIDHDQKENAFTFSEVRSEGSELAHQYAIQRHFFNPRRCLKSKTKELASIFQKFRLSREINSYPYANISNTLTRRLITAERATLEASIEVLGYSVSPDKYRNELGWFKEKRETIMLGTVMLSYHHLPRGPNHIGNFWMKIPNNINGDYDEILKLLLVIAKSNSLSPNKPKEQCLANIMLSYAKRGRPILLRVLKNINSSVTQIECDQLNTICYLLFVKEVSRRIISKDPVCQFPIAIMLARVMKLISRGFLSFSQVFANDAPYGVMTGKNLTASIYDVKDKMERINALYNSVIYNLNNSPGSNKKRASGKHLRKELQLTYGGDSDTDGAGYSTDENQEAKPDSCMLLN